MPENVFEIKNTVFGYEKKTEKVVYQITRHKIAMVEVQTEQEKEIVENLNRDFERTDKANKTFAARCLRQP